MADLQQGHIFTTEPLAMRAFAAELRHDPAAAGRMVAAALGEDLGNAQRIRCEVVDREHIDLWMEFAGSIQVGIEGKIGHTVTIDQTTRERGAVRGRLILLVKEREDVERIAPALDFPLATLTWKEALAFFQDPRITLEDIEAVKDAKRIARRALGAQDTSRLPNGWLVEHQDGTGGWPSITVWGPDLPDGRYLMLQIEMRNPDEQKYAAAVGISVKSSEFEPFDANAASAELPAWVIHADRVGQFLQGRLAGTAAAVLPNPAGAGKQDEGASKIAQAMHYGLPLRYAKGYVGDYLGIRTRAVSASDLGPFSAEVLSAAVELDDHLRDSAPATTVE